jgi:hypothetical protein
MRTASCAFGDEIAPVDGMVVVFSGFQWMGCGGSPLLRWWEPPPAPTRVLLDPRLLDYPRVMEVE